MNLFHLLRPVAVLLVAVGSVIFAASASGVERGYHTVSTAMFTSPNGDFVAAGNGTHLGNYTEVGNVSISGTEVDGWAILTGINGDELYVTIDGQVTSPTTIVVTITFEGSLSTGRFEGATGSATVVAEFQPDGTIEVVGVGTIDY